MDENEPTAVEEASEEDFFPFHQEEFSLEEIVEEGEEDEDEKSDSFTGMSAADKKKHQVEYVQLLKEIECQNKIVEQLKDQLFQACDNPCLTKCQLREIKKLRSCMENENLKLQCMIQRAIKMQNELPSRCWDEVPIETTIEDDVFPMMGNYEVMTSLGLRPKETSNDNQHKCKKNLKKKKQPCPREEDGSVSCKFLEMMAQKDKLIKQLSCKLKALEKEVYCQAKRSKKQSPRPNQMGDNYEQLQNTLETLKRDLKCLCKENEISEPREKQKKPSELQKLKENYAELLYCICKKDAEIKELSGRAKGYCGGDSSAKAENVDLAELKVLREKVQDMKDEQEEYRCIIKEQSEQLDEYRRKYMDTQQQVEEQKSTILKNDMNTKRIEAQIDAEVKRIKTTFKEQISELSQYPKLLENEQIKHATVCKERDELEGQLRLVCKELKSIKASIATKEEKPDCSQKLATCEKELLLLQNKVEILTKEKEIIAEEMLNAKLDLDTLRAESAKIITNNKERFEITKLSLNSRIDCLEKELAQCRANASLSITDREAVIKEMQSQLSTLSYSFDSAQKQIKTLKNHISFLSNDQCIPIKC
ncbi:myosin-2 heavy chain [Eupeodes corollae]|uniref:myosin-2 heavy chain n=1 Tax=Eupeodes corollae TaxID=290404 RepID=UPI0024938F47|nr:myosin-2 heavy chain [Eupeodes corollae]